MNELTISDINKIIKLMWRITLAIAEKNLLPAKEQKQLDDHCNPSGRPKEPKRFRSFEKIVLYDEASQIRKLTGKWKLKKELQVNKNVVSLQDELDFFLAPRMEYLVKLSKSHPVYSGLKNPYGEELETVVNELFLSNTRFIPIKCDDYAKIQRKNSEAIEQTKGIVREIRRIKVILKYRQQNSLPKADANKGILSQDKPAGTGQENKPKDSKKQPWKNDTPDYMPLSEAIVNLADNKPKLSTLSKKITPDGSIRYMRHGQRCKVHIGDFREYAQKHYLSDELAGEIADEYMADIEARKAKERKKSHKKQ